MYAEFTGEAAFRSVGWCLPGEIPPNDSCIPVGRFTDDNWSPIEADIDRLVVAGMTRRCNLPVTDRFCQDDGVAGERMATFLHRALDD